MKRNKYLVSISSEHHIILLFCWKIRAGARANISYKRIQDYINYFWRHILHPHLELEERHLFAGREDKLIQRALADHKQLGEYVSQLPLHGNEDNKDLLHLADMVHNHTRFEERELFPHLEKALSDTEIETIGRFLITDHAVFKDEYTDEFWVEEENTSANK